MNDYKLLEKLHQIAATKKSVIYNICFRKAGVGIQFCEQERIKTPEVELKYDTNISPINLDEYMDNGRIRREEGLVVYSYYPTLKQAITEEIKRLEVI